MHSDRLEIDELTTLEIARSIDASQPLVSQSTAYLEYVASHVGHPDLQSQLGAHADDWSQSREELALALEELAAMLNDMVSAFTSTDAFLHTQVPVGSPDALDHRRQHGWASVTGVSIDAG